MREVTSKELKELQIQGKKVLLDLYGSWCSPCKILMPKLEQLEPQHDNVVFAKMDVDKNVDFSLELNVRSVPTVIIYDGDKVVNRSTGVNPGPFYTDILNSL